MRSVPFGMIINAREHNPGQKNEPMKSKFLRNALICLLCLLGASAVSTQAATPQKLLVVTVTKGFRHSSIPTAEKVLADLGQKSGVFTVDYVRNDQEMSEKMTAASLAKYDGVIFANTTGA